MTVVEGLRKTTARMLRLVRVPAGRERLQDRAPVPPTGQHIAQFSGSPFP